MSKEWIRQMRRVAVTEPIATARPYDYADAFEIELHGPHRNAPEAWVKAGMDSVPVCVAWIVSLADGDEEGEVVESNEEVVRLEPSDPLMHNIIVGRNIGPSRRRMTSVLRYKRPMLTGVVWTLMGVVHRRAARYVITADVPSDGRVKVKYPENPS